MREKGIMEKSGSVYQFHDVQFDITNDGLNQKNADPNDLYIHGVHNSEKHTSISGKFSMDLNHGSTMEQDKSSSVISLDTTGNEVRNQTGMGEEKSGPADEFAIDISEDSTPNSLLKNPHCGSQLSLYGDYECPVCFELLLEPTTLACGHTYCRCCVAMYYKTCGKSQCPICRSHWSAVPPVNNTIK